MNAGINNTGITNTGIYGQGLNADNGINRTGAGYRGYHRMGYDQSDKNDLGGYRGTRGNYPGGRNSYNPGFMGMNNVNDNAGYRSGNNIDTINNINNRRGQSADRYHRTGAYGIHGRGPGNVGGR